MKKKKKIKQSPGREGRETGKKNQFRYYVLWVWGLIDIKLFIIESHDISLHVTISFVNPNPSTAVVVLHTNEKSSEFSLHSLTDLIYLYVIHPFTKYHSLDSDSDLDLDLDSLYPTKFQ